ncbi:Signal transduction histidine kinase [Pseudobutyrivibrio sp. YE44]|uniref:hybrid sensor histidine kinase/response regulator n=1 Tax=Pseudobutyrivibrio sp. YE44 TaxID=1520802 RepID=UPI00088BADF2|nr:ATP-binding protein [Pseudobutyrivibrio sp. YE44]SDB25980.1 Signal transduction histidine kinase [Pseudobutyrivibrio sp. YE44]
MAFIKDFMIYINIILLIGGTTSIHLGCSFLTREKNTKGFFKYAVFLLALGNGLCSIGYATMSLSSNITYAYLFRVLGLAGIDIYILAEVILITSCLGISRAAEIFIIVVTILADLLDIFIYGHPDTLTFVRYDNYTIYVSNDPYRYLFHICYMVVIAICLLSIGVIWALKVKYRRDKRLVFFAFLSNFIFAASSIPDFFIAMHDVPFIHAFYCVGVFLAFSVFYLSANNYMVFYITVNSISRDIFSTLGTGLLVFDTNYHLNLSNDYANKLLGLDKEPHRIRLKEIFDLQSGEPMKMFNESKEGIAIDYRLTANVTKKVVLVNFSCKMDKNNQPMCYILIATDLTEENRLIEEAQAANNAKSNFLSNISHEIRTPINVISGMNELILRECSDPTILKYADNINVASRNLTSLINDVLDFSKIESGKLELVTDDFNIGEVLNDSYNMFLNLTQNKKQNFYLDCNQATPSILRGDEVRLKQILTNLISNAVKYTPEYGTINILVNFEAIGRDKINLIMAVKDSGIGIKPEDIPKLFLNFQRFELSRNNTIQGTGLGLAIVKNLTELMHGTIDVDSTYGKGSTFTLKIPFEVYDYAPVGETKERFSAGSGEKYQESFTAKDARLLTVDDVQMNLDVFTGLLKKTGVKIDCALNGKDALELMKHNKYDIIFLDHMMPEMDGIEVLKKLKDDVNGPNLHTPVIMLTANATMGADRKYLADGFDDYLSKPIRPLSLENMVVKYLPSDKYQLSSDTNIVNTNSDTSTPKNKELFDKLDFLDTKAGLEFAAGDEDFYIQILQRFVTDNKCKALQEYFENEDWPNYKIAIHSIKGTSLTIGATELSVIAKAIDAAVKEENYDYVKEHHAEVLEKYGELIEKMKGVV